jgi:hypothetical protein
MLHQKNDLKEKMSILEASIKIQCGMLRPNLEPDSFRMKICWEASLCPAPLLNEIDEPYKWSCSHPKRPSDDFLFKLQENNISSFLGFLPLTKDGMFIEIHPDFCGSKVVFVPYNKMLLCPMQVPCVDAGNPRCKFSIYLIPDTVEEATVVQLFQANHEAVPIASYGDTSSTLKALGELVGF